MAYRSDLEALQARHSALEAEIAALARERDEVAQFLADARARAQAERDLAELAVDGPIRRHPRFLFAASVAAFALMASSLGYRVIQPRRDRAAEAINQLARFTDELCGCSTAACAQHVMDDLSKWSVEYAKQSDPPVRIDQETMKRASEIAARMGECMTKLHTEANSGL